LVQAVGTALAGPALVVLAARPQPPVDGPLQARPPLGVQVALDVVPAVEGFPDVQEPPLDPLVLLSLHLAGRQLVDQAQAPAEEVPGVPHPGLLQQASLGLTLIP